MNSSHQLDIVRFVTGLEVTRVSGEVGTLATQPELTEMQMEVEDTVSASLHYANGAIGSLVAGAHLAGAEGGGENISLHGAHGQIKLPSLYGDELVQLFLRRAWGEPALAAANGTGCRRPAHFPGHGGCLCARVAGQPLAQCARCAQVLAIVLGLYRAATRSATDRTFGGQACRRLICAGSSRDRDAMTGWRWTCRR